MTTITSDVLKQLEKLTAIQIDPASHQKLQENLQEIITMVEKLDAFPFDENCHGQERVLDTNTGLHEGIDADALMQNVKHPVTKNMISLETSTTQA